MRQICIWICVVFHKQIYNEIFKQEKEKINLKRKFDGKRVMSAGLSVDNYWFQAMWTTHGSKCKPPGLAKVKHIVKSNFKEQKLKLNELIDKPRKVYFKFV